MSNTFTLRNTQGNVVATIREREKGNLSTLIFPGRGHKLYGLDSVDNLVFLLENFASAVAPINPIGGQTWWNTSENQLYVYNDVASPQAFERVVAASEGLGFNVIAGAGLTGGGFPTGSPLTVTLNVGAGTGITLTANGLATNDGGIIHSALLNYVANQHIDHTAVTITHGNGLSSSSANLATSQTLNIGAGTGITVNANDVAVNSIVVRTFGNQTIAGQKNFITTTAILASDGTAGRPGFSFDGDTNVGIYLSGPNELSFSTGGTQRFRIESNGVLRSLNTGYESFVTEDDDIPNKKYVDTVAASAGGSAPTENTIVGVNSLAGLTIGKKYLIHVTGITRNNGTGNGILGQVRIYQTGVGSATLGPFLASSPYTGTINWPDGNAPQSASLVWTATVANVTGVTDWKAPTSSSPYEWQNPFYMAAVQLTP